MALLPMSSSMVVPISPFRYSLSQLKGTWLARLPTSSFCIATNIHTHRWIFYSAVNSVTPLIVLNLGFQTNSWKISIRQLAYTLVTLVASIPITYVT